MKSLKKRLDEDNRYLWHNNNAFESFNLQPARLSHRLCISDSW